jgi:hypothetical protein
LDVAPWPGCVDGRYYRIYTEIRLDAMDVCGIMRAERAVDAGLPSTVELQSRRIESDQGGSFVVAHGVPLRLLASREQPLGTPGEAISPRLPQAARAAVHGAAPPAERSAVIRLYPP